jgi:site-specific DNA recombinase
VDATQPKVVGPEHGTLGLFLGLDCMPAADAVQAERTGAAVAAAPRRYQHRRQWPVAALYVRVSSREQVEGYSLDAQRRACREFAASRGYTVVAEFSDEGVSAHTDNLAKRPEFQRLMAEAEAGRFGVVVAHKIDRFARKLRTALECLERLGRARVGFASVGAQPRLLHPQGFLFLSMLSALAEWYSRNVSTETRKGLAERKRRGLCAGRLPFGVVKGSNGVPQPDTAPLEIHGRATNNHQGLLLAFERAAEGATDAEVAELLNTSGYRPNATARRARFTRDATRSMLANRFYVGELPLGKRGSAGWLPAAHAPIVPLEVFEQVQRQRGRRTKQATGGKVNRGARVHALSGMARCALCAESMHIEGSERLACWGRRQVLGCRSKTVAASVIEQELGAYLRSLRLPEDAKQEILAAYHEATPEAAERSRQRQALESQLRRLADLGQMGDIERKEYEARRGAIKAQLAQHVEADAHGRPEVLENLYRYLQDAGAAWDDAEPDQRNRLARALFDALLVRDGHLAAVRPRQEFQPYFNLLETATPPHEGDGVNRKVRAGGPEGIRTRISEQLACLMQHDCRSSCQASAARLPAALTRACLSCMLTATHCARSPARRASATS